MFLNDYLWPYDDDEDDDYDDDEDEEDEDDDDDDQSFFNQDDDENQEMNEDYEEKREAKKRKKEDEDTGYGEDIGSGYGKDRSDKSDKEEKKSFKDNKNSNKDDDEDGFFAKLKKAKEKAKEIKEKATFINNGRKYAKSFVIVGTCPACKKESIFLSKRSGDNKVKWLTRFFLMGTTVTTYYCMNPDCDSSYFKGHCFRDFQPKGEDDSEKGFDEDNVIDMKRPMRLD